MKRNIGNALGALALLILLLAALSCSGLSRLVPQMAESVSVTEISVVSPQHDAAAPESTPPQAPKPTEAPPLANDTQLPKSNDSPEPEQPPATAASPPSTISEATPTSNAESLAIPDNPNIDAMPRIIEKINPSYPELARAMGIEGILILAMTVNPDGTVENAEIIQNSAPGYGFDTSALKAAYKMKFEPITENGTPIRVRIYYPIRFVLKEPGH